MSQIEDMEAIQVWFRNQTPITETAGKIRTAFLSWFAGLGWYDKNMNSGTYDEARTRRNTYNLENVKTQEERTHVENVLATGQTTEQAQGKPRPALNPKTGAVGSQVKNPTVPLMIIGGGGQTLTRVLQLWVKPGDDVKKWQTFLGISPQTGYFDNLTDKKTRAWQTANGLKADGAVGPLSWERAFPPKRIPVPPEEKKLPEDKPISVAKKPAKKKPVVKPPIVSKPPIVVKPPIAKPLPSKPLDIPKPLHKQGALLTSTELKENNAKAGSTWSYSKSGWVIVAPKDEKKGLGQKVADVFKKKKAPIKKKPSGGTDDSGDYDMPEVKQAGMLGDLTSPVGLAAMAAVGVVGAYVVHKQKQEEKKLPPHQLSSGKTAA